MNLSVNKNIIYSLVIINFILPSLVFANKNVTESSIADVSYEFDKQKIQAAKDSFHFLRSFVDLFYLVYKANESNLPTITKNSQVQGWCVGDAHAENFGILLQQDRKPLFTMNDMDDSGPCPVVLDLFRLMVSSRLYDSNTKLDKLLDAYLIGLQNKKYEMPPTIQDLLKKSFDKGITPSDKKISGNNIIRDDQMHEVSNDDKNQIIKVLKSAYVNILPTGTQIVDIVSTSKIGGGSGGLLRYEVLLNTGNTLLHLELKEEVRPSIYPVAVKAPETTLRIQKTIQFIQGSGASKFYTVVQISGKNMMIRPRFSGNLGISLDKETASDNKEIIRYEAYTLGRIHSNSIKDVHSWIKQISSLKMKDLENEVLSMTDYFDYKFKTINENR